MNAEDLQQLRVEMDQINEDLKKLLIKRLKVSKNISEIKKKSQIPLLNEAREKEILCNIVKEIEPELAPYIEKIFREILKQSLQCMKSN